jgi:hypothetical protein
VRAGTRRTYPAEQAAGRDLTTEDTEGTQEDKDQCRV